MGIVQATVARVPYTETWLRCPRSLSVRTRRSGALRAAGPTVGCGASPAVRVHDETLPGAAGVSARSASTKAACCGCRAATSAALQVDPIEKKPFFHAYPGALALQFGMLGCDLSLRLLPELGDVAGAARSEGRGAAACDVDAGGARAIWRMQHGAHVVTSAPTTSRSSPPSGRWKCSARRRRRAWSARTSPTATARRRCSTTSRRTSTLYKVDLKGFDDRHYRELGGTLQPVLDTIKGLKQRGIWLEIVTLRHPRLQRLRRRAETGTLHRRRRQSRHPLAHHRLPPGLPR